MKQQSVLTILMFLFHYHMDMGGTIDLEQDSLLEQLEEAGFNYSTIINAFGWLANLAYEDENHATMPHSSSIRVFSEEECKYFNLSCRRFITSLVNQGILNPVTREMVINRVIELKSEGIDISLIKWVTLMVLFKQNPEGDALTKMELLVLDNPFGRMQ